MGTTALFAELVVGGTLTLTWITLLGMTVLGPCRVTLPCDNSSLTTGLALALAYVLGVVFDRIWDFVLDITGVQDWLRSDAGSVKVETEIDKLRRRVFGAEPQTAVDFVNYHRSRIRVARASVFNFALITWSGMALLATWYGGVKTVAFALVGVGGSLLCGASALAFWILSRSHDRVLRIIGESQGAELPTAK